MGVLEPDGECSLPLKSKSSLLFLHSLRIMLNTYTTRRKGMATVISKEHYQSRAKRIWQDIMTKELEHNRENVSDLEFKLAFLQRKIAKFRSWNYQ